LSDELPSRPDFSERLHALRGEELRRLPPGAGAVLHGGAAERWYFEWFDELYPTKVDQHIGVEYFAAQPDDLPPHVTWLRRTLGDISPIADGSVDLVFGGQVIEHLWPDDVAGFLVESHRVLRPDGTLVLDSPNRRVTEEIRWLHPQHTCELSVSEAVELVRLAGFDVESIRGVVLGYDREGCVFLGLDDESVPWDQRAELAAERPEDSFVWWLTARRMDRSPRPQELTQRAHDLGRAFRNRRLQNLSTPLPTAWGQDQVPHVGTPPGYGDNVLHGPMIPLDAGRWRATFRLRLEDVAVPPDAEAARLDACCSPDATVLGGRSVLAGELDGGGRWTTAALDFALPAMVMGFEARVFASPGVRLGAQIEIELSRVDDAPTGVLGDLRASANIPEPRTVELLGMLGRRTAAKLSGRSG
jgi:SAM-dependent methyltransferase